MARSSRKHPSTNSVSDPAEMRTCDSDRWFRQFKILTPRGGWRSQSRAIRGDLHRGSCRRDEIRQWVGRQGISMLAGPATSAALPAKGDRESRPTHVNAKASASEKEIPPMRVQISRRNRKPATPDKCAGLRARSESDSVECHDRWDNPLAIPRATIGQTRKLANIRQGPRAEQIWDRMRVT